MTAALPPPRIRLLLSLGAVLAVALPPPVVAASAASTPQAAAGVLVQTAEGVDPATVTDVAGQLGLTARRAAGRSVLLRGSADRVRAVFGRADSALGAALQTPAALRGLVTGAVQTDSGTRVVRPLGLTGQQLDAAYSATPATGYPTTRPADVTAQPIVATLEFSGWDASALTAFAQQVIFTSDTSYDPVTSGQYTAVSVDGASPAQPDGSGGDTEVALDQEALLAAGPSLRQRAYVAPNTNEGYLDALNQVLADTLAGQRIIALSTSWGECEALYGNSFLAQADGLLAQLTAAGVTVFAASGDNGAYDCAGASDPSVATSEAVDFPASSPHVVGVGATTHATGATPGVDTVWSQPGGAGGGVPVSSSSPAGSGGGVSIRFTRPSWQTGFTSSATRAVPDLAEDGDPATGLDILVSNGCSGLFCNGRTYRSMQVGGSSLSAPLAAAQFVTGLPTDLTRGFGDIHPVLYAAAQRGAGAFTDVTTVTGTGGEGNDPKTVQPPGPGYDKSSGLGTPVWSVLFGELAAPSVSLGAPRLTPRSLLVTVPVTLRAGLSPVASASVQVLHKGSSTPDRVLSLPSAARSATFTARPGRSYTVRVTATDTSGRVSQVSQVGFTAPLDDRSARRSGSWSARTAGSAYAGTYLQSSSVGAALSWSFPRVASIRLGYESGPDTGILQVLVDGKRVATIDTGGAHPAWGRSTLLVLRGAGRHSVAVTVAGRHVRGHANTVRLDSLLAA